jgi:hypothetical protein
MLLSVRSRASLETEVLKSFDLNVQFTSSPDAVERYVFAVAERRGRLFEPADLVSMLAMKPNRGSIKYRFFSGGNGVAQLPHSCGKSPSATSLNGARLWKNQPQLSQVRETQRSDPKSMCAGF